MNDEQAVDEDGYPVGTVVTGAQRQARREGQPVCEVCGEVTGEPVLRWVQEETDFQLDMHRDCERTSRWHAEHDASAANYPRWAWRCVEAEA